MATGTNGNGRQIRTDINVTPLIDVLLVLLIFLMVVVPMVPKGQEAILTQPPMNDGAFHEMGRPIVVSVLRSVGTSLEYEINEDVVSKQSLSARLAAIYAFRAERGMYLKGDDEIHFSQVAEVMDMGRAAGVDHVALLTPKVSEGN